MTTLQVGLETKIDRLLSDTVSDRQHYHRFFKPFQDDVQLCLVGMRFEAKESFQTYCYAMVDWLSY